jgi:hypothetical protein
VRARGQPSVEQAGREGVYMRNSGVLPLLPRSASVTVFAPSKYVDMRFHCQVDASNVGTGTSGGGMGCLPLAQTSPASSSRTSSTALFCAVSFNSPLLSCWQSLIPT